MNNKEVPGDFFFGRGNDTSALDANRDLHQDLTAAQAQIPGVNSLGGQGSHIWGTGSWNNQANLGVPPPPGNNGYVLSHVSIGSANTQATSVVATSGYFGSTRRTPAEINAHWMICPKTAWRAHGSCNYSHHQEATTCALPHIFASAKYFHAKNSEGKASNKYTHL